jgi:cytochrome c biogenesis protein CcdA
VPPLTKLARLATQAAAAQKSLERPLAPPAGRVERVVAFAGHRGFAVGIVISVALVLGLLAVNSEATWLAWLRIALGLVLIAEGLLLATDWRGARRLTLWRMRRHEPFGVRLPLKHRIRRALASPGLQLLGLIWLGVGLLAASLGLSQLV